MNEWYAALFWVIMLYLEFGKYHTSRTYATVKRSKVKFTRSAYCIRGKYTD